MQRTASEVAPATFRASGAAPGKVILFGEHAVVYGRPALAVPVADVHAEARVLAGSPGGGVVIAALDLGETLNLRDAPPDHPLAAAARAALDHLGLEAPDWRIEVTSTIPIAGGLGSGAAVSVAIARAAAAAAGRTLTDGEASALAYEIEKLHHGTPSGVDNTVVAYGRPVYFVRGRAPEPFAIGRPFHLAVADSGIPSPTKVTVGEVRARRARDEARYEALFDAVAGIVEAARGAIASGLPQALGPLMDANQALLAEIGVSSEPLHRLADAARGAGAGGAKLSGGGRGGNVIALVTPESAGAVRQALLDAGAARVIVTAVG
jgi:mevalonate kinase